VLKTGYYQIDYTRNKEEVKRLLEKITMMRNYPMNNNNYLQLIPMKDLLKNLLLIVENLLLLVLIIISADRKHRNNQLKCLSNKDLTWLSIILQ
jgi:hypothetical protein